MRSHSALSSVAAFAMVILSGTFGRAETPAWSVFQNGGKAGAEQKLPLEWSPETNIAWTADIEGYGQSTPIVAHGCVVVTSTSGGKKENYHLTAFAVDSGEKLWQVDLANPSHYENTPMVSRAAPSAVATESGFIAFYEGGMLTAVSASGEQVWEKNLVEEYGAISARHGLAASLEQNDKHLFVWVERGEDPYVLALDKSTGEEVWKSAGVGSTSWSSPRLVDVDGGQHLVCSAMGKIIGLDPESGKRLWEFDGIANNSSCTPTPVSEGQFLIGASEGRGESSSGNAAESNGLVEITKADDGNYQAAFKWTAEKATSSFGSPVVAGDTAALINRAGVLYRLDLETGEKVSVDRIEAGSVWATPIVVGDLLYVFGYKGTTSVVSLADGKEVATNRCWEAAKGGGSPFGGGNVLYAAAAASPYLILRRGDKLFAIRDAE